jgi:hypothetical protein
VGGNPADEVGDEVVESAVVERGRAYRHQAAPTVTLADSWVTAPVARMR